MVDRRLLLVIAVVLVVAGIVAMNALFIVDQTEQALVLQFGQPRRVIREPGLWVKRPFLEDVSRYDNRLLDFEPPPEEVIVSDQKRLVVDTYTRYRITDPLLFYQTVNSEAAVRARLSAMVNGSLRRVLGNVTLSALLSHQRSAIMTQIRDEVSDQGKAFGIDVIDVRIRRADLPEENSQAIYARMSFGTRAAGGAISRRGCRGGADRPRQRRPRTHGDPSRGAARCPEGARRRRCREHPDLRRRLRAGQGVLRLLSLDAGLSRRAQRPHYLLRADPRQRLLPFLRELRWGGRATQRRRHRERVRNDRPGAARSGR